MKCVICDTRPARKGKFCANCTSKIESDKRKAHSNEPFRYVTYQGHVVAFYSRNGDGKLSPELLNKRNPETLPKANTIDLNVYQDGFERSQIKALKAVVLQLAHC